MSDRRVMSAEEEPEKTIFSGCRSAFMSTGLFSFVINLLMLSGPLFMLQVYDRVLTSRSVSTLVALTLLIAGLFIFLGILRCFAGGFLTVSGNGLRRKPGR